MAVFRLKPTREALHGALSPELPAAVTIDSGDSVEFETLEADWRTEKCMEPRSGSGMFFPRSRETDCGQALMGPVYVRGAEPGMTLAVHVDELVPGNWGWSRVGMGDPDHLRRIGCGEGEYFLTWDIDRENKTCMSNEGHRVALRPFMGLYAVVPAGEEAFTTYVPGAHGGNLDCKELAAGSTIYFPVFHEGALFSLGDGHAAQGNGESGCTAIECPYEKVKITFELVHEEAEFLAADTPAGCLWLGFRPADRFAAVTGRLHHSLRDARRHDRRLLRQKTQEPDDGAAICRDIEENSPGPERNNGGRHTAGNPAAGDVVRAFFFRRLPVREAPGKPAADTARLFRSARIHARGRNRYAAPYRLDRKRRKNHFGNI